MERYRHVTVTSLQREDSVSSFSSVHSSLMAPWFTAADSPQPQGYFYAKTELPNGKPAALIDPGAWTTASGEDNGRALAVEARKSGYKSSQMKMSVPLKLAGVGDGVQECNWEASIPVAIPNGENTAHLFELETPLIGGTGSQLPIIIGLKTMSDKNGVLEMGRGRERLTFPGPGGYEIKWAPDAVHIPLERAKSGHLMAPLTAYDKLPTATGGVKPEAVPTLHAMKVDDPPPQQAKSQILNTSLPDLADPWERAFVKTRGC